MGNDNNDQSLKSFRRWIFGLAIFSVLIWVLLWLYLAINTEFSTKMTALGSTGDFFNIATSLASVVTVILVAYGVSLQRQELNAVKQQIEDQTESAEKEQRKNRTHKMMDDWVEATLSDGPFKRRQSANDWTLHDDYIKWVHEGNRRQYIRCLMVNAESKQYLEYIDISLLREHIYALYKKNLENTLIGSDYLIKAKGTSKSKIEHLESIKKLTEEQIAFLADT